MDPAKITRKDKEEENIVAKNQLGYKQRNLKLCFCILIISFSCSICLEAVLKQERKKQFDFEDSNDRIS